MNFLDYAVIAGAWMTDSNDANYVEQCDLEDSNSIDYNDLRLFCDEWLWESPVIGGWMMSMGGGGMDFGLESMLPGRVSGNVVLKAEPRVPVGRELDESVVKELLELLDKLWLDGEFDKYVSEKDYLALRAALEDFWR